MRKIKTNGILEEFKIQIGPARNSVQGELCGQQHGALRFVQEVGGLPWAEVGVQVKQVPGGPAEDCVGDEQGGQQREGGPGVQEMSVHP